MTAIDLIAETRRLESMGVVLGMVDTNNADQRLSLVSETGPLHPHPKPGRKRKFASDYERLKAHRRNKSRMITK